jgi:thioredoxin-related protein
MKKLLFLSVTILAAIILYAQQLQTLALGANIPNATVKMKDISGKDVSIENAKKGNGVLVMFSCNTCPVVVKNQQRTKAIAAYALKHDIGVILLNSNEASRDDEDSFEAMQQYAKQQGYNWNYVVDKDSKFADAFGATRTPEVFLFNKEGKLVYKGAMDDNATDADNVKRQHLKTAIDEYTQGKAITLKESRSVGCGIKRP